MIRNIILSVFLVLFSKWLLKSIENLRDTGNSIVIVEHDEETMKRADWIVDIGPFAGEHGGQIIGQGKLEDILKTDTLTGKYLSKKIEIGNQLENTLNINISESKKISLKGVKTNNLKDITLNIPLNTFTCITGVSGSGKSSLINDTLYPALMNRKMNGKQIEIN